MTDETRPSPDALLARVQAEAEQRTRGRLKIFFGMAPGVGKTYAMLEAARRVAKEGVDVVVGYVEQHARPETYALVLGLDVLPRKQVEYRGKLLQEFDLNAALARKPRLIVVDELAHSNPPGMLHARRWQDVEDLLAAGIDVYTTLNVQHLESLNDVVTQITSVPVRETVPDHVFEQADEVALVDIAPDDLVERLREGKVYVSEQAARAIEHFFRKGNLIALRELALRKTAERVGSQAIDYRRQHEVERIWPTSERLLVCVGPSPLSGRLVRATCRMAASLHAPWISLHVESDADRALNLDDRRRLDANLQLAEELGGTVATAVGQDFAATVVDYCRRHNITKIIAGKPRGSRWSEWWRGVLVSDLIRASGEIDVYVISGDSEEPPARRPPGSAGSQPWSAYGVAVLVVTACTLASYLLAGVFSPTNLAMIYLGGVVAAALQFGRGPSILATVLGVLAFDALFVPPFGTLAVSDTQYLFTFAIMLTTGLVVSQLAARVRLQAHRLREREQRTAALLALSKSLAEVPTRGAVVQAGRRTIQQAFDVDACIACAGADRLLDFGAEDDADSPPAADAGVVRWVFEHGQPAGHGSDTLPGTAATYVPLTAQSGVWGVLGVRPRATGTTLDVAQRDLLYAFARQIAAALERCSLAEMAEQTRLQVQTERLRNTLLSTVSHDLRTPLATITGAAGALAELDPLSATQRRELAEAIVDESERLNRLVSNLLDLTRLEARAIVLQTELQPIEEVVGVAIARLERTLRQNPVAVRLDDDLPPVAIDALLMQQVLTNLLDNAAKFAPAGSPIELVCRRDGTRLVIEIADRGPGLPPGEERRVFERFYQAPGVRSGSGIGLAICRGIVELHGGTISAENRSGGGALFRVSLPLTGAPGLPGADLPLEPAAAEQPVPISRSLHASGRPSPNPGA